MRKKKKDKMSEKKDQNVNEIVLNSTGFRMTSKLEKTLGPIEKDIKEGKNISEGLSSLF